ncbi:MAG: extracellular solute-binding protein [Chloroflexi bacterium]|nr:extracellular solute-binding protein [Chloroflexota bacterium]
MSKMFKALVPVMVLMALVVVSVAPAGASATAAQPIVVEIFVGVGTGSNPEQLDAQVALADEWNASRDDIQIEFTFHDNTTARDELLTRVAAGDAPAIVGPAGVRSVMELSDLWLDISDYIEADMDELGLDDFDQSSFGLYELGDETIAIPLGVYPSFVFVNETLFEEAGVDLPPTAHGEWTWDDLREKAIALTQDENGYFADEADFDPEAIEVYGYMPFWTNFRASTVVFSPPDAGVALNEDGTATATFNQEAIRQSVNFYHNGIFVDHFIPTADAEGAIGEGVTNPFTSGRIGMGISHTWLFWGVRDAMTAGNFTDDWNVYPTPTAPNGVTTARVHADTFAILKDYDNPDAAWEVLKWLTSQDIALELCQVYGCLPARLSARADWEAFWLEAFPQLDLNVVYEALEYLDAPNHEGYMPNFAQAWDALELYWGSLRSDPDFDVEGELDAVNAEVQALFDEAMTE